MRPPKLIYKNEWEYDSYFYRGQQIQDLTQVEIENKLYNEQSTTTKLKTWWLAWIKSPAGS